MSLKFLSRYFLILTCVTALSGCGVREDYVTAKVEKMQTWQICKRLLENKSLSFQIAWYNQVLQKRGENCERFIGKFSPPVVVQTMPTPMVAPLISAPSPVYAPAPIQPPPMQRSIF
jgi:hypothetical protein